LSKPNLKDHVNGPVDNLLGLTGKCYTYKNKQKHDDKMSYSCLKRISLDRFHFINVFV